MLPEYVVQKILSAIESGDIETTRIYLSSDFVFHGPTGKPLHREQFIELINAVLVALPNIAFHVSDLTEKNDTVRLKTHIEGTNSGKIDIPYTDIKKMDSTGRRVTMPEIGMEFTVKRDKLTCMRIAAAPKVHVPSILRRLSAGQPVGAGA